MSDTPRTLPDCMMPDGGECCIGYQELQRECASWKKASEDFQVALLLSQRALAAEAEKRGMLRAAEIAGDSLGEDSDACCLRTIQRVCAAIEKEANK